MKTKIKYGLRAGLIGLMGLAAVTFGDLAIKNKSPELKTLLRIAEGGVGIGVGYCIKGYYRSRVAREEQELEERYSSCSHNPNF